MADMVITATRITAEVRLPGLTDTGIIPLREEAVTDRAPVLRGATIIRQADPAATAIPVALRVAVREGTVIAVARQAAVREEAATLTDLRAAVLRQEAT